jgi:GMP synthase-like glutamine amidotransferase
MKALVLQHIDCEPPGVSEDVLVEHGIDIHRVELDRGEPLPPWSEFDAVIAMGGPMSVNDDADHPWLTDEKRAISDAVHAGVPFWGVCLGVQLLAASLGARVYPGPTPEVGLMNVTLSDAALADPVFEGLPREVLTLQWHGDTFDLPDGAVALAGSPAYPNQAFRWGERAYGVQFHLEVSTEMAKEWATVPAYEEYLELVQGPGALPRLIGELEEAADTMRSRGRTLFERWLDRLQAG